MQLTAIYPGEFVNFGFLNTSVMTVPDIIIAIDGYSSTGKSTFAKLIAKEFGFLYLDSGALYRGVTLFALENGMIKGADIIDLERLVPALETLDIHFEQGSKTYMGCRSVKNGDNIFRWQEVACSPECGVEYLRRVNEARNPVSAPVEENAAEQELAEVFEGVEDIEEDD